MITIVIIIVIVMGFNYVWKASCSGGQTTRDRLCICSRTAQLPRVKLDTFLGKNNETVQALLP